MRRDAHISVAKDYVYAKELWDLQALLGLDSKNCYKCRDGMLVGAIALAGVQFTRSCTGLTPFIKL